MIMILRLLASMFFGVMASRLFIEHGFDPQIAAAVAGCVGFLGVETFDLARLILRSYMHSLQPRMGNFIRE